MTFSSKYSKQSDLFRRQIYFSFMFMLSINFYNSDLEFFNKPD